MVSNKVKFQFSCALPLIFANYGNLFNFLKYTHMCYQIINTLETSDDTIYSVKCARLKFRNKKEA